MWKRAASLLIAASICGAGGALFYVLHTPLPWMLGSLSAAALSAVLGGRWFIPAALRNPARPVVGVLVGSSFTAGTLSAMAGWWDAILLVIGASLLVTAAGYVFFHRAAGFDRRTALIAAAPAGIGEMALLAGTLGGDVRRIVIAHLMRILTVIFAVPFIAQVIVGHPIGRSLPTTAAATPDPSDWAILTACAVGGFALSRLIRIPAGVMIFPMLLSAAAHIAELSDASPPAWLVTLVQVVIGGVVGARFAGIAWREMRRTVASSVVWAGLMLTIIAGVAWFGSWLVGRSFLAMLLALAPGGTVEMVILTYSVGFEVVFAVTCQVCRIISTLLLTPMIVNLLPAEPERRICSASGCSSDQEERAEAD